MNYVLLGNGAVAVRFLCSENARKMPPRIVVLNREGRQRDATELIAAAEQLGVPTIAWSPMARESLLAFAAECGTAWLLSVYFGHIVDAEILEAFSGRAVNLHPAYLPWNRGVHTNVWPLIDGSPAGVTLHKMVEEVDAGPILTQRRVHIEPWDTAATLYEKLENMALSLLVDGWPDKVVAAWPGAEPTAPGNTRHSSELVMMDGADIDSLSSARALYDRLRARTFRPHAGLRLKVDGVLVEVTIDIRPVS